MSHGMRVDNRTALKVMRRPAKELIREVCDYSGSTIRHSITVEIARRVTAGEDICYDVYNIINVDF